MGTEKGAGGMKTKVLVEGPYGESIRLSVFPRYVKLTSYPSQADPVTLSLLLIPLFS